MAGRLAFSLDLGGTQLRAALVAPSGEIVARKAVRSDAEGGPDAVMDQIAALFASLAGNAAVPVVAVGASVPGPLDTETGTVLLAPRLSGWVDVPLRALLAERFGLPVALENDGIAAAVGEWRFGAGRDLRHMVYVTVSTGIGGGVICDGHVLHGRRGMAGHLGHILAFPESGALCSCGAIGCFEALACGSALNARVRALSEQPEGHALRRLAAGTAPDARHLFAAAAAGDRGAGALVADEARLLGMGFVSLLHAFSPELIVVGGGVANGFALLAPGIAAEIRARAMPAFRDVPVVRAACGGDSGLVGAAGLAFDAI